MNEKHGMSKTKIYRVWVGMRHRCYLPSTKKFRNYGGRGIKVCPEWLNDFTPFYIWAMDNGYREGLTIDRIDGDGDYSPDNCRFATYKEQNNNTKQNCWVTINGETKTIAQWRDQTGIKWKTLRQRVQSGVSGSDILVPVKKTRHVYGELIKVGNESKTLKQWARELGIGYGTIHARYYRGLRDYELIKPLQGNVYA